LIATGAQRFSGTVQIQTMPAFVLHLGNQNGFALQAWRPTDPIALGQHAHNFAVRVLANLANQSFAISVWHPIAGLHFAVGIDAGIELGLQRHFSFGQCFRHGFQGCVLC